MILLDDKDKVAAGYILQKGEKKELVVINGLLGPEYY